MQHTIQQLFDKVNAMRDLAIVAHRMKYARPSEDNFVDITHIVEQIQSLAGDIYNDKEMHPKVKTKQENIAWNELYDATPPVTENGQDFLTEIPEFLKR